MTFLQQCWCPPCFTPLGQPKPKQGGECFLRTASVGRLCGAEITGSFMSVSPWCLEIYMHPVDAGLGGFHFLFYALSICHIALTRICRKLCLFVFIRAVQNQKTITNQHATDQTNNDLRSMQPQPSRNCLSVPRICRVNSS